MATKSAGSAGNPKPDGFDQRMLAGTLTDNDEVYAAVETDRRSRANQRHIADGLQKKAEAIRRSLGDDITAPESKPRLTLVSNLVVTPPEIPHFMRIADAGGTLLFGKGGTGKGSYAAWLIVRAIRELDWKILLYDAEHRAYEWKPRFEAYGLTDAEQANIAYYEPSPEPIWDQIPAIQAELANANFVPDLTTVDSVARACGADISTGDTSLPVRYYAALDELCIRHLSIAHVGHGDTSRPFGSARWTDDARLTWGYEAKSTDRLLINRKSNLGNISFPKTLIAVSGWTPTTIPLPSSLTETPYQAKLADQIFDVLSGPMDYDDINEAINAELEEENRHHTRDAVKSAMKNDPRFTKTGGSYKKPIFSRTTEAIPQKANMIPIPVACATCHEIADPDQIVLINTKRYHPECAPQEIAS